MGKPPSSFTCPECGGALWEMKSGKLLRYRCHVGHGYTVETLLAAQSEHLEDALWSALRALEESAEMRRRMAERARKGGLLAVSENYAEQARMAEHRAGLLRKTMLEGVGEECEAAGRGMEAKALESRDRALGSSDQDAGLVRRPAKRRKRAGGSRATAVTRNNGNGNH
jgi:two-component system chemotaxis response regulator CheB